MGKRSKYVIVSMFFLYIVLFATPVFGSFSFSSGPNYPSSSRSRKYGGSGSSYYDDDYYGKPKYQPLMTDDDVADIKPESMLDHFIYAFNRIASGYIYPYIQLVWNYTFAPIFKIIVQSIDGTLQWIYTNTIHPIFLKIQENINYIAKCIVDFLYNYFYLPASQYIGKGIISAADFIRDGVIWTANAIYDYIIIPLKELSVKIQENISHIAQCVADFLYNYLYLPVSQYIGKCISCIADFIRDGVMWTANTTYDYILIPFKDTCVKIWKDYLYHVFVTIYDSIINLLANHVYGIIVAISDGAKKCSKVICNSIVTLWNDYMHPTIMAVGDVLKKCWQAIYDGIAKGIEWTTNKIYHYLLKPLGRLLSDIWVNYIRDAMIFIGDKLYDAMYWINEKIITTLKQWVFEAIEQTLRYIYDAVYFVFSKIFNGIWTMISHIYHFVVWILEFTKRYLLEINVGKLNIHKNNEDLNNFEVGVYYGKVKGSAVYLKKETVGDDAKIYLWLRNNNVLKHANAKIIIYNNNDTQIHKRMVRLNKKMSHSIPFNKTIFEDKDENRTRIRIEFMLEDITKTKQDQDNRQSIIINNQNRNMANRYLNNNDNNDNNNNQGEDNQSDDEFNNVALGGIGATYIAVDKATKCHYEFHLCYQ